MVWLIVYFGNHLTEKETAGSFTWLYTWFRVLVFACLCSISLPHGAMAWLLPCECGISWPYSIVFTNISYLNYFKNSSMSKILYKIVYQMYNVCLIYKDVTSSKLNAYPGADPGFPERGFIYIYKAVGVRFVDFILRKSLNIPWKWKHLVSLRQNHFIFIGYLKTGEGAGRRLKRTPDPPLDPPLDNSWDQGAK